MEENQLIKSASVANLVQLREGFAKRIREAETALKEAEKILVAAGFIELDSYKPTPLETLSDLVPYGSKLDGLTPASMAREFISSFDAEAWKLLMNESNNRSVMSQESQALWDKNIRERKDIPELSIGSVEATFRKLQADRPAMFADGVAAAFRGLSWDFKTNKPFAFGKKFIMKSLYGYSGFLSQKDGQALDDLLRAMHVLDGRPAPAQDANASATLNRRRGEKTVSFGYFDALIFKNGNAHFTFKRLDLVAKLNRIIADRYPGALPHDPSIKNNAIDPDTAQI